jgi:hypothetical protein
MVVVKGGWPQNVSDWYKNEASCSPLQEWIETRKKQDYRNVSIKIVSQHHLFFVTQKPKSINSLVKKKPKVSGMSYLML